MEGKMKAIVKHHQGYGAQLKFIDIPKIKDHEVLIKVKATSICGTDVHIYKWDEWAKSRVKPPYIFGHEFSGIVVKKGTNVTGVNLGDSVSAETHIVCGKCPQCLSGKAHICIDTQILGVDIQGCFAEYVVVPASNVWVNPREMAFDLAAVQEPMGNAVHTVLAGEVTSKSIAVIGCGPIGLMAIGIAKAAGASLVIGVDVNQYRLNLAKSLGAKAINVKKENLIQSVLQLTGGTGVDIVCEMSGNAKALNEGLKMVSNGGRVSILGLPTHTVEIDVTNDIVFKGLTIQGISGRKMFETWQQVVGLIRFGRVDLNPVITHRFQLDDFEKGFKLMMEGNCGKVVLYP